MVKICLGAKSTHSIAVLVRCETFHEGIGVVAADCQPADKHQRDCISTKEIVKSLMYYVIMQL